MTNRTKIASTISKITEPMLIIALLIVLGAFHAGIGGTPFFLFLLYILAVSAGIWIARLRIMSSMHTNWDISERPKRVRMLLSLLATSVLVFLSFAVWRSPRLLWFCAELMVWLVGFFLITLKTKISGHIGILTLFIGYLTRWYGLPFALLFATLPLVGWSRLVLKRHTRIEVIGGAGYSLLVILLFVVLSVW